jgi:hypothetical protein
VSAGPSRYFARIIRAVVVSSLGFGGGIGLLIFIAIVVNTGKRAGALELALKAAVVLGIGFSVFFVLLLLLSDLTWRLYAAKGLHEEIWELDQTRKIELDGPLRQVRALGRHALLAVPNVKAVTDQDNELEILASIGQSWKSPGEKMQLLITPTDQENHWLVRCNSSCLAANVAFDYGKNFENVEAWQRAIQKLKADPEAVKNA